MVRLDFGVDKFSWRVIFINEATTTDLESITSLLKDHGASDSKIDWCVELLPKTNCAVIYTNKSIRTSIIILTKQTTKGEFVNSLTHEILHLSRHIERCDNDEGLCNALGDLAVNIYFSIYKN